MSISLKQFLELPKGAILSMSKQSFAVTGFMDEMELREPVFINQQTGERLHGAIYVLHLLRVESLPSGTGQSPENIPKGVIEQVGEITDLMLKPSDLPEPSDEFYCSEVMTGRLEHASCDKYFTELYSGL